MASSSQMQNLNSESASDDYIGDKDSLDTTLEDGLVGGMNYTQEDQFLNLLCDSDKLARSCAETLNHVQPPVGSLNVNQEEMDYPDEDEEGLGAEFTGDVDVEVVNETQTFNITGTVKDLRQSGYTKDEITRVLADEPVVEKLDDQEDTEDEGIEQTQPLVELKEKTRRPSERIILKKLGKKIDGIGSGSGTPVELE
ncbi:hypothetical protein L2E82_35878 [Cichorium intybus]|uniref:Uncharacterized protein n=1 Tax=Cichorium intybus TaxID=13427 RepID=A0ACB9BPZ4_CICIN|nr:hypothetical protein L2E82_35878 [Cichorium intybus]